MPIELNDDESLDVPQQIIPAIKANTAWIETVIIRAPMDGTWSAITESHPTDGVKVYRRDEDGNDTMIRIESSDLQADMAKDPSLVTDINMAMGAIISITGKIKALRDKEATEQEKPT